MKVNINPNNCLAVRTDNLVLLDDLNISTYSDWVLGGTGAVGNWGQYVDGSGATNERVNDTTPWGDTDVVWKAYSSLTGTAGNTLSAGIYTSDKWSFDNSKTYRFSCWCKRIVAGTAGTLNFGVRSFNSGGSAVALQLRSTGANSTNVYFHYTSFAGMATNHPVGQWVLDVGFVYPYGTATGGTANPDGGVWNTSGTKLSISNHEDIINYTNTGVKFGYKILAPESASYTMAFEFYRPRIDLVDGTEPSLTELLRG